MKVRPILFSYPMVSAMLGGRKTQTRRILKPQPYESPSNPPRFTDVETCDCFICPDTLPTTKQRGLVFAESVGPGVYHCMGQTALVEKHSPYGQPGDLLWVRESIWQRYVYTNDSNPETGCSDFKYVWQSGHAYLADGGTRPEGMATRPSIHMPRWASRLTLELTEVRVERLQDISEADALADGGWTYATCPVHKAPERSFFTLWESINSPGSWDANPWVWVLSFRVHQKNVDQFIKSKEAA